MNKPMILNLVHRPELNPEYAEIINSLGLKEVHAQKQIGESLDIFKTQQAIAHRHGLKTTIQMTYASLFNDEAVALAKEHHRLYGDEISLTLLGLPCTQFNEKYQTKDFCIWMFSQEDKKRIVDDVFALFYEKFHFYPASTGSYYMDSFLLEYIKSTYPSVVAAVATCWEEGPKAYHTTNNSWYTFMDGGPWNPWIPSKANTHAPASNKDEDIGIVAIPHLSRDLMACFDGNGSNYGTHPQNVLRGMIYEQQHLPYLLNLIDQYRYQATFNDGHSYNMMFVGPGWMNKKGRWEAPYELLLKSYEDAIAYYGQLKKTGQLIDMTLNEFALYYRSHKTYHTAEIALWEDILYGSNKQLFWYVDDTFRTCLDMNQGGAMTDLRPYVAKLNIPIGIGTGNTYDASYPYLIQANYRAGYFTHYAGEGTLRSCKVRYQDEVIDLALVRTTAQVDRNESTIVVTTAPFEIKFRSAIVTMQSIFTFTEGSGAIQTERRLLHSTVQGIQLIVQEYITLTYGTTEYAQNMDAVIMNIDGQTHSYAYKNRLFKSKNLSPLSVVIPPVETMVSIHAEGSFEGYIQEGYAFSPMVTLGVYLTLLEQQGVQSWLKLQKAR
jgi:hypothetical protein